MRLLQRAASGAAVLVLLTACGTATEAGRAPVETTPTPKPTPSPTMTTATPTPTPTPTPTVEATELIDFRPANDTTLGVMMATAEDAKKLTGAPAEFVEFVSGTIASNAEQEGCDEKITTNVSVVDPKGWAAGSVTGCGGFRIIWRGSDEGWDQAWSGQDLPACSRLKELKVPVAVVAGAVDRAQCLEGSDIRDYTL